MSIYITGDIHSRPNRLSTDSFPQGKNLTKEDYVIILGDFGLVWDYTGENNHEKHWLDWLEAKPWTTLFLDGNHENFDRLDAYPWEEWNGGMVQKIRPSVMHLGRGEIFDLCGKRFLALGGAYSHDVQDGILDPENFPANFATFKDYVKWFQKRYFMFRIKGQSWWPQEVPNAAQRDNAICNLDIVGNKVDYILSHSLPSSDIYLIDKYFPHPNEWEEWLEENVRTKVEYQNWFSGHYHFDGAASYKDVVLYEGIMQIV